MLQRLQLSKEDFWPKIGRYNRENAQLRGSDLKLHGAPPGWDFAWKVMPGGAAAKKWAQTIENRANPKPQTPLFERPVDFAEFQLFSGVLGDTGATPWSEQTVLD